MALRSTIQMYFKWWHSWKALPVKDWAAGASLYRQGRYAEAVMRYRKGLKSHPHHPARLSAHIDLAYCLTRSGALHEAHKELTDIIHVAPRLRDAHIRLIGLERTMGRYLEAAWSARKALRQCPRDSEIAALFLISALENGGPHYLIEDAANEVEALIAAGSTHCKLRAASALLTISKGDRESGRRELEFLTQEENASRDVVLSLAELLLDDGDAVSARQQLRRIVATSPEYPRALSLLSATYLKSGVFYNPDYAVQLATTACQKSGWQSPRELHQLAEAYYHLGDQVGALLLASRAKEAGSKLLGTFRDADNVDRLIESLSAGTLS